MYQSVVDLAVLVLLHQVVAAAVEVLVVLLVYCANAAFTTDTHVRQCILYEAPCCCFCRSLRLFHRSSRAQHDRGGHSRLAGWLEPSRPTLHCLLCSITHDLLALSQTGLSPLCLSRSAYHDRPSVRHSTRFSRSWRANLNWRGANYRPRPMFRSAQASESKSGRDRNVLYFATRACAPLKRQHTKGERISYEILLSTYV